MLQQKTQFSVFLVNRPNILSKVCRGLAEAKVNILALTMMDGQEHGVLRLVAASAAKARSTLKDMNAAFTESKVYAIEMPNSPGAAADVCEKLGTAKVGINYMYCSTSDGGRAVGIFALANVEKANKALAVKSKPNRDNRMRKRQPVRRR
jgi:hypothetical protein